MFEIMKSDLGLALVALPLTIIANNLLGAALAEIDEDKEFDKNRLKRGLFKGFMVYASILLYALITRILTDLRVDIFGGSYSLTDAIYIIIFGTIIIYAKDGLLKLAEILKYKEEDEYDEI